MTKLCGREEECFEHGEFIDEQGKRVSSWGIYDSVMCRHLGEDCRGEICMKDANTVEVYSTRDQYEKLIKEIQV